MKLAGIGLLALALGALVAGSAAIFWTIGSAAIAPRPRIVGPPPADLAAEEIRLTERDGPDLVGWIARPPEPPCGAVALLHGRGAERTQMLDRARLLVEAGFAVALFDFRSHGESGGDARGFGFHEAEDAARMVEALRARFPDAKLGVVGVSLGAAAAVMASERIAARAYVLEALYSDLVTTTARRVWLPVLQEVQAQLLHLQTPLRLGHWASELRPVDRIGDLGAPLLLMAGGRDPVATPSQTKALFAEATEPKALIWFETAGRSDFLAADRRRYADAALPFLRAALGCDER